MTQEEFKLYLDMIVEKAFKEGIRYEQTRVKLDGNVITIDAAIDNAKRNILGD